MADPEPKKDFDTATLLNDHGKDISGLAEKLGKCYSAERYEDFQEAVEKLVGRYLKSTVGWAIVLWVISLIGSMLIQKFLHIF